MQTGTRREHHPEASPSQKITHKSTQGAARRKKSGFARHGISSYKKAERDLMPVCHMKIYAVKPL